MDLVKYGLISSSLMVEQQSNLLLFKVFFSFVRFVLLFSTGVASITDGRVFVLHFQINRFTCAPWTLSTEDDH